MASATRTSDTSVCPRCGAGLRCGMVAGDAECWCVKLPHTVPVPPALPDPALPNDGPAACFCPACLKQIADERHNALFPPRD